MGVPAMKHLTLTIAAVMLVAPAATALAAPGGGRATGLGGANAVGMAAHGPAPTSPSFTAPTNPNARSGNAFGHPGSPTVSCQAIGVEPGHASLSPGSPFNEPTAASAGGEGGQHYAGNVPQSAKNTASVAQYDVACANRAR